MQAVSEEATLSTALACEAGPLLLPRSRKTPAFGHTLLTADSRWQWDRGLRSCAHALRWELLRDGFGGHVKFLQVNAQSS
jgi:hypothetical protein